MGLYSRAEIEEFVEANLEILGIYDPVEIDRIRSNFADTIEILPQVHQSILIETQRQNITGSEEQIAQLYSDGEEEKKVVNGYFLPGTFGENRTLTAHFGQLSEQTGRRIDDAKWGKDVAVWSLNGRGQDGFITARHEHGHRVDYLVGNQKYWSTTHEGWREAVRKQLAAEKLRLSASATKMPLTWLQSKIMGPGQEHTECLYVGARELAEHLELYDKETVEERDTFVKEGMAEISNHHCSLYALYEGDENKVDDMMSRKYPEMWPIYRDEYLPAAQEYSDKLQKKRNDHIANYVRISMQINEIVQKPFDIEDFQAQAAMLSASGRIVRETNELREQHNAYRYPEAFYEAAERRYQETRHELANEHPKAGQPKPFYYDEDSVKQRAAKIRDTEGVESLIKARVDIKAKLKALNKLEWAYNHQEVIMAEIEGRSPTTVWGEPILQQFDTTLAEKGITGVWELIDYVTLPTNAVNSYIQARDDLAQERSLLVPPEGKDFGDIDTESYKTEIFSTIESVRGPGIKAELLSIADNLRDETRALGSYSSDAFLLIGEINTAFGFDIDDTTNADVLARFDEIYAQGGSEATKREAKALRHASIHAYGYVDAVKSFKELTWEIEYGSSNEKVRKEHDLSYEHSEILAQIREAALIPDSPDLAHKTKSLRTIHKALDKFYMAHDNLDQKIGDAIGSEFVYRTGEEVLGKFFDLLQDGGIGAVKAETDRLKLPQTAFNRYMDAKDAIEYERWEIRNDSKTRKAADPFTLDPDTFMHEIESMLGNEDITDLLQQRTRQLQGEVRALRKFHNDYELAAEGTNNQRRSITINTVISDHDYFSEQLTMASWQIKTLNNVDLSESFYKLAERITSSDYTTKGQPSSGSHSYSKQMVFTLRDHAGSAIIRLLNDGGKDNDHFGGVKSWARLRGEVAEIAANDPELIKLFKEFEINLFEASENKHGRVVSLAQSADPIPSKEGQNLLDQFDAVQNRLAQSVLTSIAAEREGGPKVRSSKNLPS